MVFWILVVAGIVAYFKVGGGPRAREERQHEKMAREYRKLDAEVRDLKAANERIQEATRRRLEEDYEARKQGRP